MWLSTYSNDIGNHVVYVDDSIGKRCVKPKMRVLRCGRGRQDWWRHKGINVRRRFFSRGYSLQFV